MNRWLAYEATVAVAEAFYAWCHVEGRDPDDPMTELVWEHHIDKVLALCEQEV